MSAIINLHVKRGPISQLTKITYKLSHILCLFVSFVMAKTLMVDVTVKFSFVCDVIATSKVCSIAYKLLKNVS